MTTPSLSAERRPSWTNKVPEVTLVFWLIKMMSTTVGETGADFLNFNLGFGLTATSLLTGILLALFLAAQLKAKRYIPWLYWSNVLLVSVFGTLVTDNLTDQLHVPLIDSTLVFSTLLIAVFIVWKRTERTLSIHSITTLRRELFYWTAILVTFALGTAAGDLVAEDFGLGYLHALLLFGSLIALTAFSWIFLKANAIVAFWIAYILTRPLGASLGDLLTQPGTNGGLGLGSTGTNVLFICAIIALVGYLSRRERRARALKTAS
ncbi:hypothetical protein [Salinicola tamaricis]|uniref:COG4705 family protein n=1 Tax=Salinicola tamaricis TaxID=1771309 RepID=UPI000D09EED4|nr:hypothetical protein [Salinicola tamaricis]